MPARTLRRVRVLWSVWWGLVVLAVVVGLSALLVAVIVAAVAYGWLINAVWLVGVVVWATGRALTGRRRR